MTTSTTITKIPAPIVSQSADCPAVETAIPRKKPNNRLITSKDNRRQGFRNYLPNEAVVVLTKPSRRVFSIIEADFKRVLEQNQSESAHP